VLINAFFKVMLKSPLSELIVTLKVIIDFANHFRPAEYDADYQLNLSEISAMHFDRQLMLNTSD